MRFANFVAISCCVIVLITNQVFGEDESEPVIRAISKADLVKNSDTSGPTNPGSSFWVAEFEAQQIVSRPGPSTITVTSRGYLVSRALEESDGTVQLDELWRRPVESMSLRVRPDGDMRISRHIVTKWDDAEKVLTTAYTLSTSQTTMLVVDRMWFDTTDPADWTVSKISSHTKFIDHADRSGLPLKISIDPTGEITVEISFGAGGPEAIEARVGLDNIPAVPPTEIRDSRYKELDSVRGLVSKVARAVEEANASKTE